jgi:adenylate cyclase
MLMQMNQLTIKRLSNLIFAVLLAAAVGFALTHFISLFNHLETRTQDIREAGFSKRLPQDEHIVIAAITEETLSQFPYRSPVDRSYVARLLKTLEAKQARGIYLDFLLDQSTEFAKDDELREVIRTIKTPLAIGYTESPEVVTPDQLTSLQQFVPPEKRATVNLATDPFDGTVRWLYRDLRKPDAPEGVPFKLVEMLGMRTKKVDEISVNTPVAWRRPPAQGEQAFAVYPSQALSHLPDEWIKGKLVMVGAVLSITDKHRTPFAVLPNDDMAQMPGVIVLAHQTSMLLDQRVVNVPSVWQSSIIVLLFALLGAILGWVRKSLVITVLSGGSVIVAYWLFAISQYDLIGWQFPLVAPSLSFVLAMFLADVIMGKEERDRRKFVQNAFSRYLAPAVVQKLVDEPDSLAIEGEKKTLSFIFTDIQGFTTLSEKIAPDVLSNILNDYLEGMCNEIDKFQGTIDKFIGDSVMCFFNAPIDQPDHANRALQCALALDVFCEAFRERYRAKGIEIGMTRIGVHSGVAVVGNFGSSRKMEFTALGDTVNAASRTEGVNKYFGTRICVTDDLVRHCGKTDVPLRPIGHIVLKGKINPIILYEPMHGPYAAPELIAQYLSAYQKLELGLESAKEEFLALSVINPFDGLVKFHLDRIEKGHLNADVHMEDK